MNSTIYQADDARWDSNIVDTTPANGNVWKMLLGSINPWFDADYDSEDTESGYKGEPDVVGLGFASVDVLDK